MVTHRGWGMRANWGGSYGSGVNSWQQVKNGVTMVTAAVALAWAKAAMQ